MFLCIYKIHSELAKHIALHTWKAGGKKQVLSAKQGLCTTMRLLWPYFKLWNCAAVEFGNSFIQKVQKKTQVRLLSSWCLSWSFPSLTSIKISSKVAPMPECVRQTFLSELESCLLCHRVVRVTIPNHHTVLTAAGAGERGQRWAVAKSG